MTDGNFYLSLSEDGKRVVKYDTRSGKEAETIFDVSKTRETSLESIEGYTISPDGSKLLVWTDKEEVYRYSFTAKYYFYEFRSRLLKPLSTEHERQQAPVFHQTAEWWHSWPTTTYSSRSLTTVPKWQ